MLKYNSEKYIKMRSEIDKEILSIVAHRQPVMRTSIMESLKTSSVYEYLSVTNFSPDRALDKALQRLRKKQSIQYTNAGWVTVALAYWKEEPVVEETPPIEVLPDQSSAEPDPVQADPPLVGQPTDPQPIGQLHSASEVE